MKAGHHDDLAPDIPGCYGYLPPNSIFREKQQRPEHEGDPTMDFSPLFIAKPMPFKFDLTVRSQVRAKIINREYADQMAQGELPEPRSFWTGGVQGDRDHGWGAVFS